MEVSLGRQVSNVASPDAIGMYVLVLLVVRPASLLCLTLNPLSFNPGLGAGCWQLGQLDRGQSHSCIEVVQGSIWSGASMVP